MIIALTGSIGSGKGAVAFYLQDKFGFKQVNMLQAFATSLGKSEVDDEVLHAFFDGKSFLTNGDSCECEHSR